jgi:hypothetical protein
MPIFLGNKEIGLASLGSLPVSDIRQNIIPKPYVTDGLVLYMDSTEPDSYPGTGTSWFNLVDGQPYVGTLGNSVTYTGGYLQTSTANPGGEIRITTSSFTTGPYTIMSATRYTDTVSNGRMLAGATNNWLSGQWSNTTENYFAENWVFGVGGGPNDTNWRIYTATGDQASDSWSYFINGVNVVSGSTDGVSGPNGLNAGMGEAGGERSDGQIAFVMVYNKILSQAEVTQNYNVLKSKVGL